MWTCSQAIGRHPSRCPYFKEFGLTYLHLMPLFSLPRRGKRWRLCRQLLSGRQSAAGNDGSSLTWSAEELRREGISLVVDFIFNHTSDEHEWAMHGRWRATRSTRTSTACFPTGRCRTPTSGTLREIFPGRAPGSFTYIPEIHRWVWTTFHSYQWDFNYGNPAVFRAMLEEMLRLANAGVEVLRLDAVAFIWKQLGTSCENLPEAHMLIQAFNAFARIAAPALLFKSEGHRSPG